MLSHTLRQTLLNQLAEMPAFLHPFADLPPALLCARSQHDGSPLLEHLWHLVDCESELYGARIERVLTEAAPQLAPVQVSHWPEERGYLQREAGEAVRRFGELRAALVERLGALPDADFARHGIRFDGSLIDVVGLVEQIADHDRDHRRRMTAILADALRGAA